MSGVSGWRAILADTATRLEPGGDQTFEEARGEALRHLEARLSALRPDMPATRRAGLRLALLRILHAKPHAANHPASGRGDVGTA